MASRVLSSFVIFSLVLVFGCETSSPSDGSRSRIPPAQAAVNTTCPIMGGPVDPQRTIVFEGRPVAFCCQDCMLQWISMSSPDQHAALARARAP